MKLNGRYHYLRDVVAAGFVAQRLETYLASRIFTGVKDGNMYNIHPDNLYFIYDENKTLVKTKPVPGLDGVEVTNRMKVRMVKERGGGYLQVYNTLRERLWQVRYGSRLIDLSWVLASAYQDDK